MLRPSKLPFLGVLVLLIQSSIVVAQDAQADAWAKVTDCNSLAAFRVKYPQSRRYAGLYSRIRDASGKPCIAPQSTPSTTPTPTCRRSCRDASRPSASATPAPTAKRRAGALSPVWLKGGLYGSDNVYAAVRSVTIAPDGDHYRVTIENQFGFTCKLFANAQGDPGRLEDCLARPEEARGGWKASPRIIYMECSNLRKEVVCDGAYTLSSDHTNSEHFMTIARKK